MGPPRRRRERARPRARGAGSMRAGRQEAPSGQSRLQTEGRGLLERERATCLATAFERGVCERQHFALKPLDVTRPWTTWNEGGGRLDGAPNPHGVIGPRLVHERQRELAEVPRDPDAITEMEGQIAGCVQKSVGVI